MYRPRWGHLEALEPHLPRMLDEMHVLGPHLAEVRALSEKRGTADLGRSLLYLSAVRAPAIRTRRADNWLDTPLPKISEADRKRTNRDIAKTQAGDYFRTVYDLMVLAFQTDVTRVATFSLGGEGDAFAIPEIGITESVSYTHLRAHET